MDLIETANAPSRYRHPWETSRLKVLRGLIARHVTLGPAAIVVDIGCGDAFVIGELARAFSGVTFIGVDAAFTGDALRDRQSALPANVQLYQRLESVPGRAAALVLLMDVIEHIEDDRQFLVELLGSPLVDARTRFVVTVPAYQSLFSSHDVFLKHYRRYTNAQLRRRLDEAGLRVDESGYFFTSLLPLRLFGVIKERLLSPSTRAATGLSAYRGGAISTRLLSALLTIDASAGFLLRRAGISVPGLSVFAVCRPSA